jgi:hypothetical protein
MYCLSEALADAIYSVEWVTQRMSNEVDRILINTIIFIEILRLTESMKTSNSSERRIQLYNIKQR